MDRAKYKYRIFQKDKLVLKSYVGVFSISDFKACMIEAGRDTYYDPTFYVINDFRDSELIFEEDEIHDFVNFVKNHKLLYGKRKITFLTNTPNQTVFTSMLDLFKNETNITIQTFSTLLAVIRWLNLPLEIEKKIDDYFNEMKNAT
jgi:hypothetical protein